MREGGKRVTNILKRSKKERQIPSLRNKEEESDLFSLFSCLKKEGRERGRVTNPLTFLHLYARWFIDEGRLASKMYDRQSLPGKQMRRAIKFILK